MPNQPAGAFWAVLNRLLIIFQVIVLILSELGWPAAFFAKFFPVLGADFVLSIPGDEFIALVQADHNTFMEAAMLRRVSSTGSGYEYLRMTNALVRIIDICRDIAVDAGYADACADRVARTTVLEEA